MKTIIHDLDEKNISKFNFDYDDVVIDANKCKNKCCGCFSCWIKHPKECIYNDSYSNIADYMGISSDLVIISRCRYGCYDSQVKRVLERCIGYVLPYFTIREGFIHHKRRFNNNLRLKTYFYGDISDEDKKALKDLVRANAINLDVDSFEVNFITDKEIHNAHID